MSVSEWPLGLLVSVQISHHARHGLGHWQFAHCHRASPVAVLQPVVRHNDGDFQIGE